RRTTTKRTGAFMAFVTIEDVYGSIECVAFPAIYERVKAALAMDKIVAIKGKLDLQDGKEPSVILDDVKEFDVESYGQSRGGDAPAKKEKRRQSILWLNATALSDEDFDDMVTMLSNYEGKVTCAIVRGDKKYKLPFGINYCRGLLAELSGYIFEKDIKLVE
ncbi:MAG: OB-fold nucleic acid binding domain-containing protein, partial [Candidatus Coproplasma sp.]